MPRYTRAVLIGPGNMGKEYTEFTDQIQRWMEQQRMFFVATAPLSGDGIVNCSPKGLDCLRVQGGKEPGQS